MRKEAGKACDETIAYLDDYKLKGFLAGDKAGGGLKRLFKRYYSLLVWHHEIEHGNIWNNATERNVNFKIYYKELVSDTCLSLVLYSQGIYKPALLSLRSALENFIRCIGIAHEQSVLSLTSVYELINVVKDAKIFSDEPIAKQHYAILRTEYSRLCEFVHTASVAHMAHTEMIGIFPRFDKNNGDKVEAEISRFLLSVITITSFMLKNKIKAMHHTRIDALCDALPTSVKARVMNA